MRHFTQAVSDREDKFKKNKVYTTKKTENFISLRLCDSLSVNPAAVL